MEFLQTGLTNQETTIPDKGPASEWIAPHRYLMRVGAGGTAISAGMAINATLTSFGTSAAPVANWHQPVNVRLR